LNKQKVADLIRIITDSMIDLQQAKDDHKARVDSALDAYSDDLTGDQIKAIMAVAKAKVAEKLEALESSTDELMAMIEMVKQPINEGM